MDENESGNRKIDYFPQNYINDIASDPSKITQIIESLFYEDKEKSNKIKILNKDIKTLELQLNERLVAYFSLQDEIKEIELQLKSLGNKAGIKNEVEDCSKRLECLAQNLSLSDEDKDKYKQFNSIISLALNSQESIKSNLESLQYLIQLKEPFFNARLQEEINYNFTGEISSKLSSSYDAIVTKAGKEWSKLLNKVGDDLRRSLLASKKQQADIYNNAEYKRLKEIMDQHSSYIELQDRFMKQNARLEEIKQKESDKKNISEKTIEILNEIFDLYKKIYLRREQFCQDIRIEKDNLIIEPKVAFKNSIYNSFCEDYFYTTAISNQDVINYEYDSISTFMFHITNIVYNLLNNKYKLKKSAIDKNIIEELLTTSFFEIQYDIQYQNDNLIEMSEGKIAFVILRLLLDFSKNDNPILIDQPEDDLDNRAIYEELVTYLRKKKIERQIILVTHNPNIVVGADAEEVIVANQHGTNSVNPSNVKFAYYTGALEDSFTNNKNEVLLSKGIREHVCEILEGGAAAFKLREQKYQFKLR